ncbi:MAG TPA: DegT/DnrJ/EryC1/StrS family aminotransferase [Myxococcota bacterium]|nr:DegT/DnrJ/EryC1/StrS family aminotransferase [Myxococcota bacterium]
MHVPFLDLAAATAELRADLDEALARVLDSGWYILGAEVERFERAFASYTQSQHCVGVANGLDALRLGLMALGIGPGDEVLVPSNTYIATWLAVSDVGATPIPVEPDPYTHNLDPTRLEAALTPRTRCVLPVHLYGQPADLDPILAFARAHDLLVLEDAAQSQGAAYRNKRIGAHGHLVAWSFYPGKNLGALGDAGAVTTDDAGLADKVRLLGNYGSRKKYVNEVRGLNSRLDPLQAAALSVKLAHLDAWNDRRKRIAARYLDALANTDLVLPVVAEGCDPAWHLFVVRTTRREALVAKLLAANIHTVIHYPIPPHLQAAYRDFGLAPGTLPIAERYANEVLSLPIGPHLRDEQLEHVIATLLA